MAPTRTGGCARRSRLGATFPDERLRVQERGYDLVIKCWLREVVQAVSAWRRDELEYLDSEARL